MRERRGTSTRWSWSASDSLAGPGPWRPPPLQGCLADPAPDCGGRSGGRPPCRGQQRPRSRERQATRGGEGAPCGRAEPGSRRPRARRIAAPPAPSRGTQLSTQTEVLTSRNYRDGHVSGAWLLSATPQMLPRESRKGGQGPGDRHTLLGCPSSKLRRRRGHHPRPSGPQGSHETHRNYS